MYAARPSKKQRSGEIYEEEHATMYAAFSLPWPPGNRDIELECGEEVSRNLSGRSAEVVFFCCKAFEMRSDTEFLDANQSLAWLCKSNDKSPWSSHSMFTLTGSCIPIVRQRRDPPYCAPSVRLMTGVEAMQFMGWDITDFRDIDALYALPNSNAFLCNLAGNAFSAYAIGPVLLAVVSSFCFEEAPLVHTVRGDSSDSLGMQDVGSESCTEDPTVSDF